MNNDLMFSSAKGDWETPRDLFGEWDKEFHFALDAAASHENHLCRAYYTTEGRHWIRPSGERNDANIELEDGLTGPWSFADPGLWTFCNPPYGRGLAKWVEKAHVEMSVYKNPSVLLLPARTDTKYFHRWIWDCEKQAPRPGVEVRFLPGRIRFCVDGVAGDPAPFPSMLVVFRGDV